jgi:hypothetical protein
MAYRIEVLKTRTHLWQGQRRLCTSAGRPDHLNHVLAWADENGISVANDPRFPSARGRWRIVAGKVVKNS